MTPVYIRETEEIPLDACFDRCQIISYDIDNICLPDLQNGKSMFFKPILIANIY